MRTVACGASMAKALTQSAQRNCGENQRNTKCGCRSGAEGAEKAMREATIGPAFWQAGATLRKTPIGRLAFPGMAGESSVIEVGKLLLEMI